MRIVFNALFLLAFLWLFSPPSALAADSLFKNQVLVLEGIERTYDLFVPPGGPAVKRPLVVILHGHGGSAKLITGYLGKRNPYNFWIEIAKRERLVLAFPNGVKGPDGYQGWNDCRKTNTTNPSTDDVGFLRSLIWEMVEKQNVDPARVYINGTSNGGFMTIRMALEAQDLIAAAAPVIAAMPAVNECTVGVKKIPILMISGTEDPFVRYQGGYVGNKKGGDAKRGSTLSIEDSVAWWVDHNGAARRPIFSKFPDMDPDDQSTAEKYVYAGAAPVVFIKIIGGGHTEPSLARHYGWLYTSIAKRQNKDFEMAEEIWAFFKDKRR